MPAMYTDDKKVAQILRNFISNALKFTPHGHVRVTAVCEDDRWVRFSVADNGIGIPSELQDRLFQDFAQVDSPLQRRVRGTGLGLSLCRRFAELLGGSVGMKSEVGVGSEFWVCLPLQLATDAPAEAADGE